MGMVVNDGTGTKAHLVPVVIGQDDGATVQIVSGLSASDRVIQDPPDSLIEGEKVTVDQSGQVLRCGRQVGMATEPRQPRAPSSRFVRAAKAGTLTAKVRTVAALLACVAGCKPSVPTTIGPAIRRPPSTRKLARQRWLRRRPIPQEAAGSRPLLPTECCAANGGRSTRTRSSIRLEDRIADNNQSLRQALETYLAARDQVTRGACESLSHTLRQCLCEPRSGLCQSARGLQSRHHQLRRLRDRRTGKLGAGLLGPRSAAPSRPRAKTRRRARQIWPNVDLSLHAEMASDYFQLRGLDAQTKLLTATVADLENQLDLTQRRLAGGVATEADVAQARTQLETVRAQLVDIGVARAQFEHAIGTIANLNLSDFSIPPSPLDLALPKVPIGVPSQLLERRPDIAAAERSAAAANAQIGIAVSAFYPTISLGGAGGFESTNAGTWIQGPSALWSLGAQAAELLFDAGQRRALTDQARHNYEAQVAGYRNTVLQAFNDVEDQLSGLRILEQESGAEAACRGVRAALVRSLEPALQGRRHQLS